MFTGGGGCNYLAISPLGRGAKSTIWNSSGRSLWGLIAKYRAIRYVGHTSGFYHPASDSIQYKYLGTTRTDTITEKKVSKFFFQIDSNAYHLLPNALPAICESPQLLKIPDIDSHSYCYTEYQLQKRNEFTFSSDGSVKVQSLFIFNHEFYFGGRYFHIIVTEEIKGTHTVYTYRFNLKFTKFMDCCHLPMHAVCLTSHI